MDISLIAAIGENNEIGKNGGLLWDLPHDMRRFQKITKGHTIIMGRKTFLSFPNGALPNRRHVVVTTDRHFSSPDVLTVNSLEAAYKACDPDDENFIIGGATIYEPFLKWANKMYLTHVHGSFPDADTHFPPIDYTQWKMIHREEKTGLEGHGFDFTYIDYIKK